MYGTAECREIPALSLPRNEYGFADLHRPFIDDVVLRCRCGAPMRRVPEVVDVWFDSGAMPYAEWHYPFENGAKIDEGEAFPADFITEAVDQTRGWFYTLLAVSVALGRGAPYRNVICLGHVLDAHGRKMSKSRGNAVDPCEMARKHGIDAVRWYLYTVNAPGEPKRFDESELQKFSRGVMPLVYNSFLFFETYHPASLKLRGAGVVREARYRADTRDFEAVLGAGRGWARPATARETPELRVSMSRTITVRLRIATRRENNGLSVFSCIAHNPALQKNSIP